MRRCPHCKQIVFGKHACDYQDEIDTLAAPFKGMALAVQEAVPDAFKTGCCGCRDVLRLLTSYTPEKAFAQLPNLSRQLHRATQMPNRPPHVSSLTLDDCTVIILEAIRGDQDL